jgi:phospholipase/carboxylesterase
VDFATGAPVYRTADVERGYESIVGYIREIIEQYDIYPGQIYLMGFSQGAIISYYTFWRSPELIGGIIALSGRLLSEIDVETIDQSIYSTKRVFIGHGTEDRVIPVSASELTSGFIRDIGLSPTLRYYPIGHTLSRDEIADIVEWL